MSLQLPSFALPDPEEGKVAARRAREATRRERVMNARSRVMGVEVAGLAAQVTEKHSHDGDRAAEGAAQHEQDMLAYAVMGEAEAAEIMDRQAHDGAVAAVWATQLDRSVRPEADLVPAFNPATAYVPERCGVSAAQKFGGEADLAAKKKAFAARQRAFLDAQVEEKRAAAEAELEEANAHLGDMDAIDAARAAVEAEEEAEKMASLFALQQSNLDLAAARRQREDDEAFRRRVDEGAESEAVRNDERLAETSSVFTVPESGGTAGGGRIRRDMFKGLTREAVRATLAGNEEAVHGHIDARLAAKAADDAEALEQQAAIAAMAREQHEDEALEALVGRMELREHHAMQAGDHARAETQRAADARGAVSEPYFSSFGTSGR